LGVPAACAAHLEPAGLGPLHESRGISRVDPQQHAALAAGAHRHVAVDQERQPAEHPLLRQARFVLHNAPDAVGKVLVDASACPTWWCQGCGTLMTRTYTVGGWSPLATLT
jgi:hypothetical protein